MWGIKKYKPKLPGVLIAVVLTTTLSWGIGFEKKATLHLDEVADPQIASMLIEYESAEKQLAGVGADALANDAEAKKLEKQTPRNEQFILALNYQADLLRSQAKVLEETNAKRLKELRKLKFEREVLADGKPGRLHLAGAAPAGVKTDGGAWKITQGGQGRDSSLPAAARWWATIPEGLPSIAMPKSGPGASSVPCSPPPWSSRWWASWRRFPSPRRSPPRPSSASTRTRN
jgi:SulP family sulfate permease